MAQIITVAGPLPEEELGVALCHDHVLSNGLCFYEPPREASRYALAESPLSMDILGKVRRDAGLVKDNLVMGNLDEAIAELMFFKMAGGNSLVDCTTPGIGRDPVGLRSISLAAGINIVCSAGWYTAQSHPSYVKRSSVAELTALLVGELTTGIGTTGIRAGALKVALSGTATEPFSGDEEKVLRAAARAQARTGAGLNIHPNFEGKHWHTYLDILEKEGANLAKCCANHMEVYCPDIEYQKSVAARGVYISYDQFGIEVYADSIAPGRHYGPDSVRVAGVLDLVRAGYAGRMLLANEVGMKCCYRKYGGYGYAHLLENIVPELRFKGVTEEQLDAMLVVNPRKFLGL
ncbi:MAG: hypothetical protein A2Y91_02775 [Chloroflexi bacterium RBG_13_54_8]|nr:MAG: hypothetical protein A2Y91_02775 [Chloroflexi bacterium RBG_13_54_8]